MKLKTMLLPTGEFALIASECPSTDTDDALRGFGELIGAAAVLITDEEVDVEDALVDLGAIRAMSQIPDPVELLNEWYVNPEDIAATRAVMEDREVSPAGLVKGEPGDPDFLNDPDFAQGGEPGADPEPDGVLAGGGDAMGRALEAPKVGDRVRIIGPALRPHGGIDEPPNGTVGTVARGAGTPPVEQDPDVVYVEFLHLYETESEFGPCCWYFPVSSVEVISSGR